MKNSDKERKRRRITVIATEQGVDKAEINFKNFGIQSQTSFAKSIWMSRSVVSKFFNFHPIQLDSFKRICERLELNWRDIIQIDENLKDYEEEKMLETYSRSIIVTDESNQLVIAEITLKGDVNSVENLKMLELILQQYSGYSIKIRDMKAGSIKLTLEGSPEDIQKLISRIELGDVVEVNGFPVEDVRVLDKWQLVQEIISHPTQQRNLSGVDLSDTDLSCADLSEADLTNADLSNADLSEADLTNADLSNANLSEAYLSNSLVKGAKFSTNSLGITEEIKKNLIDKGAIFTGSLLTKIVTLREWLENNFQPEWLSPKDLIMATEFRWRRSQFVVRAKEINLGGDLAKRTLALVVRLAPTDTDKIDIQVCLYPTNQSGYTDLPCNVKLTIVDEEGSDIMNTKNEKFQESLCLSFSGKFGERFGAKIAFNESCIIEEFVI